MYLESSRARRLLERLTGRAWHVTETLDLTRLRQLDGVDHILDVLSDEIETVQHARVKAVLYDIFIKFYRPAGMYI